MYNLGISLNCTPNKEHVPDIELFNRNVKEYVEYSQEAMTFKRISKLMIVNIVATAIFWIIAFTSSKPGTGMSNTKGPGQIVLVIVVGYKKV